MDSRIDHIEIFHYKIPLSLPLTTSQDFYRSGLILFIYDKDGHLGAGEIAPLKGLSKETLNETFKQLIAISDFIMEKGIESIDLLKLFPSVRFGLESAFLTLKANKKGIPIWEELNPGKIIKKDIKIRISALISRHNNEAQEMQDLVSKGYESFKIKVKNMGDGELIKSLRQIAGNNAAIIIDANKCFSFVEGVKFCRWIYPYDIKYIEDPIDDTSRLKEFFKNTGIGVAIDEDINDTEIRDGDHIRAWVIKPGIMMGLRESISLIKTALRRNIIPVLSNPFYSGLGVSILVILASAFIPDDIPMGLDTYRWIKKDIMEEPFTIKNGAFSLGDVLRKMGRIDKNLLQRVF